MRKQARVAYLVASEGARKGPWKVLPGALEETPRYQGGPAELQTVQRKDGLLQTPAPPSGGLRPDDAPAVFSSLTLDRLLELERQYRSPGQALPQLGAEQHSDLASGSPFTEVLVRRSFSKSGMQGVLTAAGPGALRKAAAPILALYFGIYSGEVGARIGPGPVFKFLF